MRAAANPPAPRNPTPGATPKVSISSTYLDNAKRRELIIDVAIRAGFERLVMENWTADERSAKALSLDKLAGADVFLGIIA